MGEQIGFIHLGSGCLRISGASERNKKEINLKGNCEKLQTNFIM